MAPNLADPGNMVPALPLNELQAAAFQAAPIGVIPANDPMVVVNNQPDLTKLNAYRRGVDQKPARSLAEASTTQYCTNLLNIAPARFQLDAALTKASSSPDPAAANSLFTFLAQRFVATYGANNLNCVGLLNTPDPVTVTTDGNGVAVDATITVPTKGNGPNCVVNGVTVAGCKGTATINGQACTFAFDKQANQVAITCPAPGQ
jgi:hypothetical protein